ncbi:MAG: Rrf2 family transcriptional regulator [Candidatus Marinimicrobia bacterium]|jgi:Rrf2 family protein|nr:Rrf2 family transcriptional regulator [Candidatus Neomarinimicrobiota bacterium]
MLKLTRKLEYSLIALSHMQHKEENELSTTKEIAVKFAIPQGILAKTLQQLAKLEIVHAVQGPHGGYKVIESLDNLSFLDFIEKMEGPQGLVECTTDSDCSLMDVCNIRQPIKIINKNLKTMFSNISLSEITQ